MKKRMLALMMAACLVMGALPVGGFAEEAGGGGDPILPVDTQAAKQGENPPENREPDVPAATEAPAEPETVGTDEIPVEGALLESAALDSGEEYGIATQAGASGEVSTEEELRAAFDAGVSTITLQNDITLITQTSIYISSGKTITLNLNGHTLDSKTIPPLFWVKNKSVLWIENGTIDCFGYILYINSGCSVVMDADTTIIGLSREETINDGFIVIYEGGELYTEGKIIDNQKGGYIINNRGHLIMELGSNVDGAIFNESTGTFHAHGGTVTEKLRNKGKVDSDYYKSPISGFEGQMAVASNGTRFKAGISYEEGSINGGISESEDLLMGQSITRFAAWGPVVVPGSTTYTITFQVENKEYKVLYLIGDARAEKPEDPEIEGFQFDGWYEGDTEFTGFGKSISGNKTLTAKLTDIAPPTIMGIEDGKTYCQKASFTVSDNAGVTRVSIGGTVLTPDANGTYSIQGPQSGAVTAEDAAGNSVSLNITVNQDHTPQEANCQSASVCAVCGETLSSAIDPSNHAQEARWDCGQQGHRKYYPCCGTYDPASGYEAHTYVDGVCQECRYECNHQGDTVTWEQDPRNHTKCYSCGKKEAATAHNWASGLCQDCGYRCQHSGGTATCITQAKCEICGEPYGALNPENHEQTERYYNASGHYWQHNCCQKSEDIQDHVWNAGECTVCNYTHVCGNETGHWVNNGDKHAYVMDVCGRWTRDEPHTAQTAANCTSKAVCQVCNLEYGEIDPSNHTQNPKWVRTEKNHKQHYGCCNTDANSGEHSWDNGVCTVCQYTCRHSGGTATCINKAVCVNCGASYGETNPEKHEKASLISRTDGHYWEHKCCGNDGPIENHQWSAGVCSVCHYTHFCGDETGHWVNNGDKHAYVMDVCGKWTQDQPHTAKTVANCTSKAVCAVCGLEYGEKNAENHTQASRWICTEGTHKQHYDCCGIEKNSGDHTWENGVCTVCQYACRHSGGAATCKAKAKCTICKEFYGELDPNNHEEAAQWVTTQEKHQKRYPCCGLTGPEEDHTGTATCLEKATCPVCGMTYGERDPNNHVDAPLLVTTEVIHWKYYPCCMTPTIRPSAHSGGTATCQHQAKCEVCNMPYGMLNPGRHEKEAEWVTTADTHKEVFPCCDQVLIPEAPHSGGRASCSKRAQCTRCGVSYGSLDPNTHLSLRHVPAVRPTTGSAGNREYWYCSDCGKYFLDAAGEKETTRENLVLPRVKASVTDENPKTGDVNLLLPGGALLGLSLLALAVIRKKRS